MKQNILFSLAAVALMAVLVSTPAFAQSGNAGDVGSDFFDTLQSMITGNVGFFLGLAITVLGIWTWIIKQQTGAGVIMIIGGVLITLAPGLFNSARKFSADVLTSVGGTESTTGFTVNGVGSGGSVH